jgi:CBS domain-containing protein
MMAQSHKEPVMPNIRELSTRKVVVAARDTTVAEAAKLMREHHVGTLVVCDASSAGPRLPVGIVTDRDIVIEVVAAELDAATITVGDIMGQRLVTARETEGVLQALEIMRNNGVRRLPIVRDDGHLVGIVSIDDLLGVLAEELSGIANIVVREQALEASGRSAARA